MTTTANAPGRPLPAPTLSERAKTGVEVEIPMSLPSVANLREHWAAKARRVKAQRGATLLALKANRDTYGFAVLAMPARLVPDWNPWVVVTLTRVAPRALDSDNLQAAFKGVRDSVAQFFCVDDNDPRIEWVYGQAKGKAYVRIALAVAAKAASPWGPDTPTTGAHDMKATR